MAHARSMQPTAFEHDPEKCAAVFGKDHAQNKKLERDDDSSQSHPALACRRKRGTFGTSR
jgi:hypothetical protein